MSLSPLGSPWVNRIETILLKLKFGQKNVFSACTPTPTWVYTCKGLAPTGKHTVLKLVCPPQRGFCEGKARLGGGLVSTMTSFWITVITFDPWGVTRPTTYQIEDIDGLYNFHSLRIDRFELDQGGNWTLSRCYVNCKHENS